MDKVMLGFTMVMLLLLLLISPRCSQAAETGRRYDNLGKYSGSYQKNKDGDIRLYDELGAFEGTIRKDKDGGRRYDELNEYRGRYTERDTDTDF
jgi:hypothetical protein